MASLLQELERYLHLYSMIFMKEMVLPSKSAKEISQSLSK